MAPAAERMLGACCFPMASMSKKATESLKMLSFITPKNCVALRKPREWRPFWENQGICENNFFQRAKRDRENKLSAPRKVFLQL